MKKKKGVLAALFVSRAVYGAQPSVGHDIVLSSRSTHQTAWPLVQALWAFPLFVIQLLVWATAFASGAPGPPFTHLPCADSAFAVIASFILRVLFFEFVMDRPARQFVEPFNQLIHRTPRAIKSKMRHPVCFGYHRYRRVPFCPRVIHHPIIIPGLETTQIIQSKTLRKKLVKIEESCWIIRITSTVIYREKRLNLIH